MTTEAGRGLVALADGVWNELVMDSTSLTVEEALTLCDHYIDMVLAEGRLNREGLARRGEWSSSPYPTSSFAPLHRHAGVGAVAVGADPSA